ncbi:MAG: RNA polymerase sigma factor [Ignavibacteriales bacterium]
MDKAFTISLSKELCLQKETCSYTDIFADIFDRYYNRIYKYMRYRVKSKQEAEDLCSQVFERVMQKIDTYNPARGPFEIWLFSIAQNTANTYYRQQKRRIWFSLESISDLPSGQHDPEEEVVHGEEQSRLLAALSSLDERERNIIALKFAGGLKNREIAELMGLSDSNTGVILYRSLHRLREILKSEE